MSCEAPAVQLEVQTLVPENILDVSFGSWSDLRAYVENFASLPSSLSGIIADYATDNFPLSLRHAAVATLTHAKFARFMFICSARAGNEEYFLFLCRGTTTVVLYSGQTNTFHTAALPAIISAQEAESMIGCSLSSGNVMFVTTSGIAVVCATRTLIPLGCVRLVLPENDPDHLQVTSSAVTGSGSDFIVIVAWTVGHIQSAACKYSISMGELSSAQSVSAALTGSPTQNNRFLSPTVFELQDKVENILIFENTVVFSCETRFHANQLSAFDISTAESCWSFNMGYLFQPTSIISAIKYFDKALEVHRTEFFASYGSRILLCHDHPTTQSPSSLVGHLITVCALKPLPSVGRLVSCSIDGRMKIWDVPSRACLQTLCGAEAFGAIPRAPRVQTNCLLTLHTDSNSLSIITASLNRDDVDSSIFCLSWCGAAVPPSALEVDDGLFDEPRTPRETEPGLEDDEFPD